MPSRTAVGTVAIVLGIVIVIAATGAIFYVNESATNPVQIHTLSTTSITSVRTIVSSQSATSSSAATSADSETCYQGSVPTNTSASGSQSAYSRTVFNVTQEFNSWSWMSLSTFKVGSYTFVTTNPATTQGVTTLEPQLFFNVTNSQGQMQTTSFTNLGGWNGQVWPPDMGLQAALFGGDATIQWLFLCNSQNVFLEVTTQ
jgi:hypothetical protein